MLTLLAGPYGIVSAAEVQVSVLLAHTPHLLLLLSPQPNPQSIVCVGIRDGGDVDHVVRCLYYVELNLK